MLGIMRMYAVCGLGAVSAVLFKVLVRYQCLQQACKCCSGVLWLELMLRCQCNCWGCRRRSVLRVQSAVTVRCRRSCMNFVRNQLFPHVTIQPPNTRACHSAPAPSASLCPTSEMDSVQANLWATTAPYNFDDWQRCLPTSSLQTVCCV